MTATVLVTLFWAACCAIPGIPIALALDGARRTALPRIALDGVVLGLAWLLLVTLALSHVRHFGPRPLLVLGALTAAAGLAIAHRRGGDLRPATGVTPAIAGLVAGVLLVATAVRAAPSYFIFMTGDMGEYVNGANQAARTGEIVSSFPHGLTALFTASNRLLGIDATVAILPFCGVLLVATLFGVARECGVTMPAAAVPVAAAAIGVAPVWFSRFPASETAFATFVACATYLLAAAHARDNRALAVAAGGMFAPLGIVRGNVAVDAVAVGLYGILRCATQPVRTARLDAWFAVAAVAGAGLGLLYDFRYIDAYMRIVLEDNLGGLYDQLDDAGVVRSGPVSAGTVLLAAAFGALVLWLLLRLDPVRRWPGATTRAARIAPIALIALAALATLALGRNGVQESAERYGALLLLLAAVAVVARPRVPAAGATVLFAVAIGCAGTLLYAKRVPLPQNHAYYLYGDRYLFGEGFPPTAALAVLGAGVAATWLAAHRRTLLPAGLLAAAGLAALVPATLRSSAHSQMEGGYEQVARIAQATADGAPLVYAGLTPEERAGFFFPNTFRAYALPLELSFGRTVLNVDGARPPFGPDPQPTPAEAAKLLAAAGAPHGWYVREVAASAPVEPAPPAAVTAPYTATRRTRIDSTIWQLRKRVAGEERWIAADLSFEVWDLRRP